MKKILVFALILLITIPYFTQAGSGKGEEEVLLSIMNELDGDFLEADISASEKIMDGFLSVSQLHKIGQDVLDSIGMVGEERNVSSLDLEEGYYIREVIEEEEYNQVSYFGYDQHKNSLIIMLTSYVNGDEKGETFLYVNVTKKEIFEGNSDIINKVKDIFVKYNKEVNITTCLLGELIGKFSEVEIEKLRNSISNLNGEIVDEYSDENLTSLTAFTDYIEHNILAGEDRINLNVALRYYEYDNKTIIWIGTPIITSGY